jgi:Family of unknown function (DUF5681)
VGKRRPPIETQFKKGQSGNPKGRPRMKKNFQSLANDSLNEYVEPVISGSKVRITKLEYMVKAVNLEAIKGKPSAIKFILENIPSSEYEDDEITLSTPKSVWDSIG